MPVSIETINPTKTSRIENCSGNDGNANTTALHKPPARRWLAAQALTGLALQALVLSNW